MTNIYTVNIQSKGAYLGVLRLPLSPLEVKNVREPQRGPGNHYRRALS